MIAEYDEPARKHAMPPGFPEGGYDAAGGAASSRSSSG